MFPSYALLLFFPQSEFCGDKPKSGAKYGLPDSLAILSEMGEVTDGVMDNKVMIFPILFFYIYNILYVVFVSDDLFCFCVF